MRGRETEMGGDRDKEKESAYPMVYSPNACQSWGSARLKLGTRNSA